MRAVRALSRLTICQISFEGITLTNTDECEGCQVHNLFCKEGTQKLHGFQCDGHFAEYSAADYRNTMVLPDGMDMVSSAPLFCAGITGKFYH
jgi:D-arabinose 1-dehydrogenase-like Zn-dependent alcohol dehydrogenase